MEIELEHGVSTGTNGNAGTEVQSPASTMEKVLRVWHVDDSKNFRELLATFLALQPGIKFERSLPSAESALDTLAKGEPPDIILLDIRMDGMNGLDAIAPIKRIAPQTAVLMLTTLYGPDAKAHAIRSGASDILLKTLRVEEIVERARQAHEALSRGGQPIESLPATEKQIPGRLRLALDESIRCQPAKQSIDMTLLRRSADWVRQVWLGSLARWRRRQSPAVSS